MGGVGLVNGEPQGELANEMVVVHERGSDRLALLSPFSPCMKSKMTNEGEAKREPRGRGTTLESDLRVQEGSGKHVGQMYYYRKKKMV